MTLKFKLEFSKGNFLSSKYSRTLVLTLVRTLNHVVTLVVVWSFSEINLYVDFCLLDILAEIVKIILFIRHFG